MVSREFVQKRIKPLLNLNAAQWLLFQLAGALNVLYVFEVVAVAVKSQCL